MQNSRMGNFSYTFNAITTCFIPRVPEFDPGSSSLSDETAVAPSPYDLSC